MCWNSWIKTNFIKTNLSTGLAIVTIPIWVGMSELAAVQAAILFPQTIASAGCLAAKPRDLKTTTRYGIFGDDEFETVVCGYLVTKEEERFREKVNIAYLRIVEFYDDGFRKAIETGIRQGNTVNAIENGFYDFSLGCFKKQKIEGEDKATSTYLPEAVQKALLASSAKQPIALLLSFGKHPGSECICCHLADQIRLYRPAPLKQIQHRWHTQDATECAIDQKRHDAKQRYSQQQ